MSLASFDADDLRRKLVSTAQAQLGLISTLFASNKELQETITLLSKQLDQAKAEVADAADFAKMCKESEQARQMLDKYRAGKNSQMVS